MKKLLILILFSLILTSCQTRVHEVSFFVDGGSPIANISVEHEKRINLPTAEKEGHTFLGWYVSTSPTAERFDGFTPITQSMTLYARYRMNTYSVTYETNGGSSIPSSSYLYNEHLNVPEEPLKNGFRFIGWYSDQALQQRYTFNAMPAHDVILYAKWDQINGTGSDVLDPFLVNIEFEYQFFIDYEKKLYLVFHPSHNGFYTFESFGDFDTYVYLYALATGLESPKGMQDLYLIGEEDDFGERQNFRLTIEMTQASVYYIVIELFWYQTQSGQIGFKVIEGGNQ